MPDKRDFSPLGYKRYSKQAGNQVEWNRRVVGAVLHDVRDMSDTTGMKRELRLFSIRWQHGVFANLMPGSSGGLRQNHE